MTRRLSPEQVQAIHVEIEAWMQEVMHSDDWKIQSIEQLYTLSPEGYHVCWQNGCSSVFVRESSGLKPAFRFTYYPSEYLPQSPQESEGHDEEGRSNDTPAAPSRS